MSMHLLNVKSLKYKYILENISKDQKFTYLVQRDLKNKKKFELKDQYKVSKMVFFSLFYDYGLSNPFINYTGDWFVYSNSVEDFRSLDLVKAQPQDLVLYWKQNLMLNFVRMSYLSKNSIKLLFLIKGANSLLILMYYYHNKLKF